MIYTWIFIYSTQMAYLHHFYLYHLFAIMKSLFYNGKKKIDIAPNTLECMIEYFNLKHIR
jgi:hypothetical protein